MKIGIIMIVMALVAYVAGFVTCSLFSASSRADDEIERILEREKRDEKPRNMS